LQRVAGLQELLEPLPLLQVQVLRRARLDLPGQLFFCQHRLSWTQI
jgi:hypothetical protein